MALISNGFTILTKLYEDLKNLLEIDRKKAYRNLPYIHTWSQKVYHRAPYQRWWWWSGLYIIQSLTFLTSSLTVTLNDKDEAMRRWEWAIVLKKLAENDLSFGVDAKYPYASYAHILMYSKWIWVVSNLVINGTMCWFQLHFLHNDCIFCWITTSKFLLLSSLEQEKLKSSRILGSSISKF